MLRESEKINWQRAKFKHCVAELEAKINDTRKAGVDIEGIERFCALVRQDLRDFTFEGKRPALEALQIEIWVDDDTISMLGSTPAVKENIVSAPQRSCLCNRLKKLPFLTFTPSAILLTFC